MSTVKMKLPDSEATNAENAPQLSYDDLMKIATSLKASNLELQNRLNDMALGNFFTRLEFLFKVVKFSDKFPEDFVKKCIDEITANMSITDTSEEEKK